jgi:hypothetical protein
MSKRRHETVYVLQCEPNVSEVYYYNQAVERVGAYRVYDLWAIHAVTIDRRLLGHFPPSAFGALGTREGA